MVWPQAAQVCIFGAPGGPGGPFWEVLGIPWGAFWQRLASLWFNLGALWGFGRLGRPGSVTVRPPGAQVHFKIP